MDDIGRDHDIDKMARGITCVKIILFICNLLFALTGILILTKHATYHHYSDFVDDKIWTAPIIVITVVAALVFVCGCLGCCGAIRENSCMILAFSILIIIIFLIEIGIGIAGYIKYGELEGILSTELNKTLEEFDRPEYQDAWQFIQTELNCCGVKGPDDWSQVLENNTLPVSCCSELPLEDICTAKYAQQTGCSDKLFKILSENLIIFTGVASAVAAVQLLIIIFACCLFRSFS